MEFDPNDISHQKMLVATLDADYDDASTELLGEDKFRKHIGASVIGRKCSRQIWYAFRWVLKPDFSSKHKTHGQMLRLFERGRREEDLVISIMKKQGYRFVERPVNPITGFPTQHRMQKQARGHMGGSMDELCYLPAKFNFNELILVEIKTANAKSFREMKKNGLVIAKPEHHAQMCVYGKDKGVKYGLYIVVNKDTDEVYWEFVILNHDLGQDMVNKAVNIVDTPGHLPPPRIAESAASFHCVFCQFKDICHYQEVVEVNCRSCQHAEAIDDGKWKCGLYQIELTDEQIKVGCQEHKGIQ